MTCVRREIAPVPRPYATRLCRQPLAHAQAGFSLLEVIAAILLLALTFTALMKVAAGSISLTQNAAAHSEAAMWARSKLDSVFVMDPIKLGTSSGQFDKTYRWQLHVTRWSPPLPPEQASSLQLYQLDLNVLWGAAARPRSAHFQTLRLAGPPPEGLPGAGLGGP
ncbi:MAG: prepilin-type N-terminal cleavage/methylation domain-containing protein [Rhodanobacter sp.]